jgi:DNA-binding NarL/FixJ family response regulator
MISGRVKLELSPISLARIIYDAVDSIRPGAAARGIELHLDVDEEAVANADADRLQQVVWNLVSNACKFTPEGGRIDVVLRSDGTTATIVVADKIRLRPPTRGGLVPAIALSAYARPEDREAALSAGFDDFLTKPAMPGDVLRAVDRLLTRPRAKQERRRARRAAPRRMHADQTP